jgi:hypothetical protein
MTQNNYCKLYRLLNLQNRIKQTFEITILLLKLKIVLLVFKYKNTCELNLGC